MNNTTTDRPTLMRFAWPHEVEVVEWDVALRRLENAGWDRDGVEARLLAGERVGSAYADYQIADAPEAVSTRVPL